LREEVALIKKGKILCQWEKEHTGLKEEDQLKRKRKIKRRRSNG
jgi:hypothetical protein